MTQFDQIAPHGGAGFGPRLQAARETAGMSQSEAAARLKMPLRVIQALEADNWEALGAPVFVRGQLRSYGRLLGVNVEDGLESAPLSGFVPEELVSHVHTPRYRRAADQMIKRAVYIVLTAAIVVPVWMNTRPHINGASVSEESVSPSSARPATVAEERAGADAAARKPLVASMATVPDLPTLQLTLQLSGDSWVEVFDAAGGVLEQGMLRAGQERTFDSGSVGRMVLGNASAVEVRLAGKPLDLAPVSRANVARFTLSSDGSIAPISP